MSNAYILPQAIIATTNGRLSDIFGRRNLFLFANCIAAVGTIVSATSTTVNQMIAGSVIMGLGSSVHQLSFACVSELVPRKHRPFATGCVQACMAVTAATSPISGSLILIRLARKY
jgi:MFS family permease